MKNDKLFWSAIDNNYAKKVESISELKETLAIAIKKSKEENSPIKLTIVHRQTKTKIKVSQNSDGTYFAAIL